MSLPVTAACLMCHFNRYMKKAQALDDGPKTLEFGKALMRMYLDAPEGVSSPWYSPQVAELFQKYYGLGDNQYEEEKRLANRFVMERFDQMQTMVSKAADPVFAGLQLAILGNYLDFAALQGAVSFEKMEQMLTEAMHMELDQQVYGQLKKDLQGAKKLLYLTDNAGEIVFDRVFAEELQKKFPDLQITFCVRGGPAANDATREDAAVAGIPFPIIDNGTCIAGTVPELISEEARIALEQSDVIISKGQGNCETLYGSPYNIYFAFLVKCSRFIDKFNRPKFTPMLTK